MEHGELKNLIPAYCLGAIDEAEKRQIEDHLEDGCPECQIVMSEMLTVTAVLASAAEEKSPPVYLKDRIMSQIQTRQPSKVRGVSDTVNEIATRALEKSRRFWIGVSGGLALASLVIVFLLARQISKLENALQASRSQAQISEKLVNDLQIRLQEKERILNVVQAPKVQLVDLRGLEPAPAAAGRVFWNSAEKKAVFVAQNLPAPDSSQDYQLWIIRGGQPIDAGVFAVDDRGMGVSLFDVGEEQNVSAFAVTLEKKGGVPAPQGEMYLIGTI
jgi:anti-sigma-K factor RskA